MAGKKGTRAVAPVQDVTQQPPGGWPVVQAGTQTAGFFFSWSVALRLSLALLLTLPILVLMLPLLLIETLLLAALILMTLKIYLNSFLLESDWYTKILLLSYKKILFSHSRPTARSHMLVEHLAPKRPLLTNYIAYALNIRVPLKSEEDFTGARAATAARGFSLSRWIEENLHKLPMSVSSERFKAGEDPVRYVMERIGDAYPTVTTVYREKLTDEALTQLCFFGLGAHRLYRARTLSSPTEVVDSGDFVVRTNFLADLPVREGLDSYGGDAYFDETTWRIKKIVRKLPRQQPWESEELTYRPGDPEWEYVKFVFRSSLFSLVTLVDHLFAVHMQVGNACVLASRQYLGPDHPVRRFLAPFQFKTISVNDNARNNLINPQSMGPRNFAFTDKGTDLAWSVASEYTPSGAELRAVFGDDQASYLRLVLDYGAYVEFLKKHGGVDTPYRRQTLQLWNIMKNFVNSFLSQYYPTAEELARDSEVRCFVYTLLHELAFTTTNGLVPDPAENVRDCSAEELWQLTSNLLTRYCYLVTAGHEQVGTVPVYAQDVSFCAFHWPKGESCGTKQTAITSATLMSFTSTPMPLLMAEEGSEGDWTHLFEGPVTINGEPVGEAGAVPPAVKKAWVVFQAELKAMAAECDDFNNKALSADAQFPHCFGMWQTHPSHLETSVSV